MVDANVTTVLLVGDDAEAQKLTQAALADEGIARVASLHSDGDVSRYISDHYCELVVLDLGTESVNGARKVAYLTTTHPEVTVVVVGEGKEGQTAAACIHQGAYDFLIKPLDRAAIRNVARRALGLQRIRRVPHGSHIVRGDPLAGIITETAAMRALCDYARSIAASGEPVLILGETGTGKDLLANALHALSGRAGAFVPVNLTGMDDTAVSDSLFGHQRGAFTGAFDVRPGLVLRASVGTLFLDEVGEFSLISQVKLLRLLQDGDYYPLGSDQPKRSTARIVAASSMDLRRQMAAGNFRKDLFYRLCAHVIEIPPLRERMRDLPHLIRHFAATATTELQRPMVEIDNAAVELLSHHSFPGNVRELRALVYDAICRTRPGERLCRRSFEPSLRQSRVTSIEEDKTVVGFPAVLPTAARMQKLLLNEALRRTGGNQAQAAAMLGLTRQAINQRMRK